ncbi:MAG: hypothetical protein WDM78_08820 [Puia sp.]
MATQSGIIGRIGNTIYYKMDGKYYMRAAPRKYKQTKATKARAKEFGKASGIGRIIRENLSNVIFNADDRSMQTKLVGKIFSWMQIKQMPSAPEQSQFNDLVTFKFSPRAPRLNNQLKEPVRISNTASSSLQIDIPALIPKQFFKASPRASDVGLRIETVMVDVEKAELIRAFSQEVIFPFDDKQVNQQTIVHDLPSVTNCLIITGIALVSYVDKINKTFLTSHKDRVPSQIVHAMYV